MSVASQDKAEAIPGELWLLGTEKEGPLSTCALTLFLLFLSAPPAGDPDNDKSCCNMSVLPSREAKGQRGEVKVSSRKDKSYSENEAVAAPSRRHIAQQKLRAENKSRSQRWGSTTQLEQSKKTSTTQAQLFWSLSFFKLFRDMQFNHNCSCFLLYADSYLCQTDSCCGSGRQPGCPNCCRFYGSGWQPSRSPRWCRYMLHRGWCLGDSADVGT